MWLGMFSENADVTLLYRGAVHARAAGYSHFQVIDYEGRTDGTTLRTHSINDPATPLKCAAAPDFKANCATWNAEQILATRGKLLGKTPAQIEQEVELERQRERGQPR